MTATTKKFELDPSQRLAVELICSANFGIVTGGPGTGKSFCLQSATVKLAELGQSFALAAPTGKAARRMTEAVNGIQTAQTVHRLLAWRRGSFTYSEACPMPHDVVIIDESSMLDIELAADLVRALKPGARLILIGDANQLPSVGPGRLLADLVESGEVPVARLTQVWRTKEGSWVARNAPRVLAGDPLELETFPDFRFFEVDSADDAAQAVQKIVRMPEYADAQVLSPQRTVACGTTGLNRALQDALNPKGREIQIGDEQKLRVGDRVIQTKNNYDLDVFNGEVGIVTEYYLPLDKRPLPLNPDEPLRESVFVKFDDRVVNYSRGDAASLELAYALTVHKCQGSEFPWIVCIAHSSHTHMLSRQLFYTAITRAKVGVLLVGNRNGIEVATSAKEPPKRNTMLIERMRKERARLDEAYRPTDPAEEYETPDDEPDDFDEPMPAAAAEPEPAVDDQDFA